MTNIGGVLGVTVITLENEIGNPSWNLGQGCVSLHVNTLEKKSKNLPWPRLVILVRVPSIGHIWMFAKKTKKKHIGNNYTKDVNMM